MRGQSQCGECSPGFFSQAAASTCTKCDANTINAQYGAASCVGCPAGGSVPNVFGTDCTCPIGTFRPYSPDNNITCELCPVGAECSTTGVTWLNIEAAVGYWRADNSTLDFLRCPFRRYCVGGSQCAQNLGGPLCALCIDGYYATAGQCSTLPSIPCPRAPRFDGGA